MDEQIETTSARPKKGWPIRITLYQTFTLFSIAAGLLLLRRIDDQQVELRTKRSTLFSLERHLYVDDPSRLAGVQKPIENPDRLEWSVYIPPDARAKLIVEGETIAELNGGTHQIQAKLRRITTPHGPATVTIEKLLIDGVSKDISVSTQEAMDDYRVTEPTTAAMGEKLPLLTKFERESEVQIWVEAKLP